MKDLNCKKIYGFVSFLHCHQWECGLVSLE